MTLTLSRDLDLLDDGRLSWQKAASCRHTDPELFFPVGVTGPAIEVISAAKEVCAQCPVQAECLEFALTTNQECGIWGGATEEERRSIRRARAKARRAASAS